MRNLKNKVKTYIITVSLFSLFFTGCVEEKKENESFKVAFLTDIHLQEGDRAVEGLSQAIDSANRLKPDFIITGGDLVMDALGQTHGRADSLYALYNETIKKAESKVYNTMGNHEIFGIYKKSGASASDPDYGEKMFEKWFAKSYYSFTHKGWKFMILNSVEEIHKGQYAGLIDSAQYEWIKEELKNTDPSTPLVLTTHIPFITANTQKYVGSTIANDSSTVVSNSREIIDLFKGYNLKLVLQGHLHTVEDIYIDGIHFLTGGAVSAGWWKGPNRGFEEGFMELTFFKNDFKWRYVDYGWQVIKP